MGGDKGRVGRTAQQPIQLMQFATLAFPSHPLPFALVPDPPPMEQEEPFTIHGRSIALIQPRYSAGGGGD